MSEDQNGSGSPPPATPTQDEANANLGRALIGHAYGGGTLGVNFDGTLTHLGAAHLDESRLRLEQAEQKEQATKGGLEAAGRSFMALMKEVAELKDRLAYQEAKTKIPVKRGKKKGKK